MKKHRLIFMMGCAVLLLIASYIQAEEGQDKESVPFPQTKTWNKIDPALQQAWLSAQKAGDMDRRFQCFASVRAPFSDGDRSFLQSKGYNVRVAAGTIVRGNVSAKNLEQVAELYFVKQIKLAVPSSD